MISRAGTSVPRLSVRKRTPEQIKVQSCRPFKAQSGDTFHVHFFGFAVHMRLQG